MSISHTKNIISYGLVALSVILFITFGLLNIGRFETTDEHFWKYDRIQKYFNGWHEGIATGTWKKTRINDKPGVSVAILSGLGMPFAPNPKEHRDVEREKNLRQTHEGTATSAFHTDQTVRINTALRTPILLFAACMLIALFWTLKKTIEPFIASIIIFFIATTPALIGMSQIINPDAILWSTMTGALIAFIAYLRTAKWKLLFVTVAFTGFALLSKYTASLLFLLFPLLIALFTLYENYRKTPAELLQWIKRSFYGAFITLIGGTVVFAIFMPAVFARPQHLLYGTLLSPALQSILPLLALGILLWCVDIFFFSARATYIIITTNIGKLLRTTLRILPSIAILFIGLLTLINAHKKNPWLPLSHLKEIGRDGGELLFPQIIFSDGILHTLFVFIAQAQNLFFSLTPLAFVGFLLALLVLIINPPQRFLPEIIFTPLLVLLFFSGGIMADIFVNVRYGIILYPFIILSSTLTIYLALPQNKRFKILLLTLCASIAVNITTLIANKPFYLTYQNVFLPQDKFVADAWGYGLYEAAQWLNTRDNAQDIVVWSAAGGDILCQFFVGSCLRPQKINAEKIIPQYIVLTRRRSIIRPLQIKNMPEGMPSQKELLSQEPVWELHMNNRPENFVRIIKVY